MPQPISIITVVRDNKHGLKLTIESLVAQKTSNWEMIIVVGESIDGTYEFALQTSNKDSRIRVLKQNGLGIYNAMNEGVLSASFEYLWFMNAGDTFFNSDSITKAFAFSALNEADLVIGGHQIADSEVSKFKPILSRKARLLQYVYYRKIGCHQSMLFRKDAVVSNHLYDPKYKIAADFDLICKIIKNSKTFLISEVLCKIEGNGFSDKNLELLHQEKDLIRLKSLRPKYLIIILNSIWKQLYKTKKIFCS